MRWGRPWVVVCALQTRLRVCDACVCGVQGPDPQSRQQVQGLLVNTERYGEQRLDQEPDVRLVGGWVGGASQITGTGRWMRDAFASERLWGSPGGVLLLRGGRAYL